MTERLEDLRRISRHHLGHWELRTDGPTRVGARSTVTPVLTADGTAAVLKVSAASAGSEHEHLVLRRWAGTGAARLLRADPHDRTVLLERLHPHSLQRLPAAEACDIAGGLYRRLHVPPMPQLPSLATHVTRRTDALVSLPRSAPIPHRLVEQVVALSRDLTAESSATDVVLHGNLHYGKVLAADREPWLAIAPEPLNGDRHYEPAPLLWQRWDELVGNAHGGVRDGVRHRIYRVVDAAGLDEDRARAWTLVRVVHAWVHQLLAGQSRDATTSTRYAAIAKAVQD